MKIWAPQNLCHDDYKMLIFSKSTILFTLISQHSVTRKRPLFQLSLICHANYGFLFYLMGYNPLISLDWCSDCSRCGQWEPLQDGSSVHLTDTISFFLILFNFLSQDVLRLILYVPCPSRKWAILPRSSCSFWRGIQDLSVKWSISATSILQQIEIIN